MGTWGFSILADDTALDVYSDYMKHFNSDLSPGAIREKLLADWKEEVEDADEGPVFWLAVARAQWDCGHLEPEIVSIVRKIIEQGVGLALWEEAGLKTLASRQRALQSFLAKLGTVNPRPKKPRKPRIAKAVFEPGDCLSATLPDGQYAALLVLDEAIESGEEELGSNLVAALRFHAAQQPTLSVFKARKWLLTRRTGKALKDAHAVCGGYRKSRDKYELVGHIDILPNDPTKPDSYTSWDQLPNVLFWDLKADKNG